MWLDLDRGGVLAIDPPGWLGISADHALAGIRAKHLKWQRDSVRDEAKRQIRQSIKYLGFYTWARCTASDQLEIQSGAAVEDRLRASLVTRLESRTTAENGGEADRAESAQGVPEKQLRTLLLEVRSRRFEGTGRIGTHFMILDGSSHPSSFPTSTFPRRKPRRARNVVVFHYCRTAPGGRPLSLEGTRST